MIPDETIIAHLLATEARIHGGGWDQKPQLYLVSELPSGKLDNEALPVADATMEYLLFLAQHFTENLRAPAQLAAKAPGLIGLCYSHEKRMRVEGERLGTTIITIRHHEPDVSLPLARGLTLIDIWGEAHQVHRLRGKDPVGGGRKTVMVMGGAANIALTQALLKVARFLPRGNPERLYQLRSDLIDYTEGFEAEISS